MITWPRCWPRRASACAGSALIVSSMLAGISTLGGCSGPAPKPTPTPAMTKPLPPLSPAEIQRNVSGAVRLSRQCAENKALGGLYIIRLMIEPDGTVSSAELRSAPTRASDPGRYSGVPRYLDAGPQPDNAVTRCFAAALRKLRFRKFGGPTVGFDHPVVVNPLPPSEKHSKARECESDDDCTFLPRSPCACPRCGEVWRRSISKKALAKLGKRRRRRGRRARRCRKRIKCKPCGEPRVMRGTRALCIRSQCSVR